MAFEFYGACEECPQTKWLDRYTKSAEARDRLSAELEQAKAEHEETKDIVRSVTQDYINVQIVRDGLTQALTALLTIVETKTTLAFDERRVVEQARAALKPHSA